MNHNSEPIYIFVYGTLMSGQPAHHKLSGAVYLGRYRLDDYAMYKVSYYPGIIPQRGEHVIGEVYAITADMLPAMDEYEDEGRLYHRRTVTVSNGTEECSVQAYIYAKEVDPAAIMRRPWDQAE